MAAKRRLTESDEQALRDMLDFARIAVRLRHRARRSELDERNERRLTIERLIELVGEAAKRVSAYGREEMTHIPWPQITGMREKLAHDYDGIDPDVLWETLRNDLPSLIRQLQAVLSGWRRRSTLGEARRALQK